MQRGGRSSRVLLTRNLPAGSQPIYSRLSKAGQRTASSFSIRASRFITLETCHRAPRGVGTLRSFSAVAMASKVIAPAARTIWRTGSKLCACSSAEEASASRPSRPAWPRLIGFPSFVPVAFRTASAAFVRSEIRPVAVPLIEHVQQSELSVQHPDAGPS